MAKKATIIAVVNQKGGTGKTTTTENLGVGLALEGKKVLLVDTDPQASLTVSLGNPCPDDLSPTLSDLMGKIMMESPIAPGEGILHHPEGVDLVPSNIELSGMEVALVNAMSRETILRQYLDTVKQNYDYILLDCMPSLGMLTVNALAAADNVLIPVQAAYLPAKGLEQLLGTINKVKRQINPKLKIEGILLTMVDSRTNYSKDTSNLIRESYGGKLKVYKTDIPRSVRAEEISAEGHSIFQHDPKGKVADAYRVLTKEVLNNAEKRRKHQLEGVLATTFLLLRQNQKLKEGWRLSAKLDRIGADLEKARKKRAEWDAKVKDLERRYREEENSEIHEMVHAANLNPEQLSELLRMFAADMAPKPDTINTMNEEETQNAI